MIDQATGKADTVQKKIPPSGQSPPATPSAWRHRRPLGQVCRGSRQQLPEHRLQRHLEPPDRLLHGPQRRHHHHRLRHREGTQKYKIALWRKVDGGAQYVDGSTYYIKTDGQNYRCSIGGLDPAASYRLTISYDSSRYYLYGGLKVEASPDDDTDQEFTVADALLLYLGLRVRGTELRLRHGSLFAWPGAAGWLCWC